MPNHCEFLLSNYRECGIENENEDHLCIQHTDLKCSICGEQARYQCGRSSVLNCWVVLCNKRLCKLLHLYMYHPQLIETISQIEKKIGAEPTKILVGKIKRNVIGESERYKAGFIIPCVNGGFIWSTICVNHDLPELEDTLNNKLKGTISREVLYTDHFLESLIPPGVIEEIFY